MLELQRIGALIEAARTGGVKMRTNLDGSNGLQIWVEGEEESAGYPNTTVRTVQELEHYVLQLLDKKVREKQGLALLYTRQANEAAAAVEKIHRG